MANPIWKDYTVNLGTSENVLFRIKAGDFVIYTGRSFMRPGQTENTIRINDICADYLQNVLPTLSQAEFTAMEMPVTFAVQTQTADGWADADSVQFTYDWSYDDAFDPETEGMAFPIDGNVDARQWLIYTAYQKEQVTAVLTFRDGTELSILIAVARSNDFSSDFNIDFSRSTAAAGSGHAVLDLSKFDNLAKVSIGGTAYTVADRCHRYALHYVNAYGGYDSLLIEGNSMISDGITRHTREAEYDNRETAGRGTYNYVNEIAKSVTLHTGWLSDASSSRMHHLIGSTEVYLEDIARRRLYPVTLKDTELQHKTYRNNGGNLVNYEITAMLAQNRIRR